MIAIFGAGTRLGRELMEFWKGGEHPLRAIDLLDRPWFAGHESIVGDPLAPEIIRRGVAGARYVVHLHEVRPGRELVRRVGPVGYDKLVFAANLDGTRRLAEAARDAGVERFVFASNEAVYGPPPVACPCTEKTPPDPRGPYGRSKLEAELLLAEMHRRGEIEPVVLRLTLMVGPHQLNLPLVERLFFLACRHLPIPLAGHGGTLKHCIHSRDAVDLFDRALTRPQAAGRTYVAAGRAAATVREIIDAVVDACHSRSLVLTFPKAVWPAADALAAGFGRPMVIPEFAHSPFRHTCYGTGRALAELGWRPKYDTIQAFVDAALWFRQHRRDR